jgi:hypothetical protein
MLLPPFCHPADDLFTQTMPSLAHFFAIHVSSFLSPAILPLPRKFVSHPVFGVSLGRNMKIGVQSLIIPEGGQTLVPTSGDVGLPLSSF